MYATLDQTPMGKKCIFQLSLSTILLASMLILSNMRTDGFTFAATYANVTVHFIDAGQGDSILIDTSGVDVLVDGGPQAAGATVLNYVNGLNITHINLMVATHMHEDHIGGLITILSSTVQVDEILVNNQPDNTLAYTNFMNLAKSHTILAAQRGQVYNLTATANLTILNPVQPLEFTDQNENSIVMRLQVGETSFLLDGDAEANAEHSMLNSGLDLKSNVLKVGHHGSRYATTDEYLDKVKPKYAIISAGKDNPYGHPHAETVQRLLAHGVTIYGTFKSGTIVSSTDGTSITFQNSPQAIPEFPSILIPSMFMLTLLCALIVCKKKRSVSSRT